MSSTNYWRAWPAQGEYVKDLNWAAKTSIQELVKDMVNSELKILKKHES